MRMFEPHLDEAGVSYEITGDFESVIPQVDAIYMTRLQDEWDKNRRHRPEAADLIVILLPKTALR